MKLQDIAVEERLNEGLDGYAPGGLCVTWCGGAAASSFVLCHECGQGWSDYAKEHGPGNGRFRRWVYEARLANLYGETQIPIWRAFDEP